MAATLSDLCMMKLAGLDAVDRGDFATARDMETALREAGRNDVADVIYAAGVSRRDTLRKQLGAGADYAGGSAIIGARVLAAVSQLHAPPPTTGSATPTRPDHRSWMRTARTRSNSR